MHNEASPVVTKNSRLSVVQGPRCGAPYSYAGQNRACAAGGRRGAAEMIRAVDEYKDGRSQK